jgi:hypothetical protein
VLFVFGEHDESAILFASSRFPTGVVFRELVIAVPFVCARDGLPRLLLPRICSGEPVVTWSGNVHYGFPKSMVPMERLGNSFVVTDERGALVLHATTEAAGPWEAATVSTLQGLASAQRIARLPVIGRRTDGTFVTSHFDWELAAASVRPIRGVVAMDSALGPGLEPRVCHGRPENSIAVQNMRWRLSWPEAPRPAVR